MSHAPITLEQQIACVRREIGLRAHLYPKWVGNRSMTQATADSELATMRAVLETLIAQQPPALQQELFGDPKS